jgi:hypothetical protein
MYFIARELFEKEILSSFSLSLDLFIFNDK